MPNPPKPGTPEFIAMVERHKDMIERETGIRPDIILDIGAGDGAWSGAGADAGANAGANAGADAPDARRADEAAWGVPSRIEGCLLGLAVGDALGTAVEFQPRGTFTPLTDIVGGGPFGLKPGQWTDDTSMALCLATSLLERGGFDAGDQMSRYLRWYREGYLSSTGRCFDIGNATRAALKRFETDGEPFAGATSTRSAGNGSLMRLAPIAMFYADDIDTAERFAAESSRTTHAAKECVDACRLFARMLCRAIQGLPREAVLLRDAADFAGGKRIRAIARGTYREKPHDEIRGTGYVVESLEAALWCFATTETFEDAVLAAANLGDDADTTAAVCGQIAGAYYGVEGIPVRWLGKIAELDTFWRIARRMVERQGQKGR